MTASNQKGKFPLAIGRSMTGEGEGPSVAEIATSFPARLLGAIEELNRFLNS